jgi:hypothetical protein
VLDLDGRRRQSPHQGGQEPSANCAGTPTRGPPVLSTMTQKAISASANGTSREFAEESPASARKTSVGSPSRQRPRSESRRAPPRRIRLFILKGSHTVRRINATR